MTNTQRTIVVTGGGSGIGRAIAQRFCDSGDRVVIVGRRANVLDDAVSHLQGEVSSVQADLSEPAGATRLADELERLKINRVDVLINNAGSGMGIGKEADTIDSIADDYLQHCKGNLLTAVLTTEALKGKLAAPGGRVINMASIAALRGGASAAYSAAKAAVIGWIYAIAAQLGSKKITANVIAPGYVQDTEFFPGGLSQEMHDALVSQTLLKQAATPQDIAGVAYFLASEDAADITGQVLQVNGGALVR